MSCVWKEKTELKAPVFQKEFHGISCKFNFFKYLILKQMQELIVYYEM